MCNYYTDCSLRWNDVKLLTLTTSSTGSASQSSSSSSNRRSSSRRAWTPQAQARSELTLPSWLHLVLQISSWKWGQCCLLLLTTLLTLCRQFVALHIYVCTPFAATVWSEIRLGTGAVAAAQSRLSHLQLFHSSVRTWMVYREIKKSLFNCNGIGALLFFIVAHEV